MLFESVPVMYAVEVGVLMILVQLISAMISWKTGNIGLTLVASTITLAFVTALLAAVVISVSALPFSPLYGSLIAALNVAGAHAFFAHRGLRQLRTPRQG